MGERLLEEISSLFGRRQQRRDASCCAPLPATQRRWAPAHAVLRLNAFLSRLSPPPFSLGSPTAHLHPALFTHDPVATRFQLGALGGMAKKQGTPKRPPPAEKSAQEAEAPIDRPVRVYADGGCLPTAG